MGLGQFLVEGPSSDNCPMDVEYHNSLTDPSVFFSSLVMRVYFTAKHILHFDNNIVTVYNNRAFITYVYNILIGLSLIEFDTWRYGVISCIGLCGHNHVSGSLHSFCEIMYGCMDCSTSRVGKCKCLTVPLSNRSLYIQMELLALAAVSHGTFGMWKCIGSAYRLCRTETKRMLLYIIVCDEEVTLYALQKLFPLDNFYSGDGRHTILKISYGKSYRRLLDIKLRKLGEVPSLMSMCLDQISLSLLFHKRNEPLTESYVMDNIILPRKFVTLISERCQRYFAQLGEKMIRFLDVTINRPNNIVQIEYDVATDVYYFIKDSPRKNKVFRRCCPPPPSQQQN